MNVHDWFKYHLERFGIYVYKIEYVSYFKDNLCLNVKYLSIPDSLGDEEIACDITAYRRFICDREETFDCFYNKEISIADFDVIPISFEPNCGINFRIVKTTVGKDVLDNV